MKRFTILPLLILAAFPLHAEGKEDDNSNNYRPRSKSPTVGMGVGMSVPSSGLDTYILRIRVNPNLMIEPMINAGKTTTDTTTTITTPSVDDPEKTETTDSLSSTESSWVGGGLSIRYRIVKRGNTDIQALGGAGYVETESTTTIKDFSGTQISTSTSLSANIGIGMENFFAPKWSAGFDVTTAIYNQSTSAYTPIDPLVEDITSTTGSGNLFSPSFRLMLAHYF